MTLPTKETVEMLRSGYPNGTRVRLVKMNDLQAPPVGTEGTVVGVDGIGSLIMLWDNGSGLNVLYGVNGAGKSSLTGSLRSERNDFGIVVDPDKLTIQCGGDEYEGGKLAVERIERALMDGVNFTQETTLSGGYPKRLCKRAKEAGYYIRLYYVGLDTAEESIRRIRNRVERGGHDIPTKDVNARFSHRFEDVLKILPYCDEAKFFDNDNGFVLVAEYRNGQLLPIGTYRPTWLSQLLNQAQ